MMKWLMVIIIICSCVTILAFTYPSHGTNISVDKTMAYIKEQSVLFAQTTSDLEIAINKIDRLKPQTINYAKTALKKSRLQYKSIEFFLSYFLKSATIVYNEANKYEVEEPFMEAREPTGFQVMETILFSKNAASEKKELSQQANLIKTSAEDINSLLFNLEIDDKQILESIRLELVRIITLGITGFDAPELKTSIAESKQALLSAQKNLSPFLSEHDRQADSVNFYLQAAIDLLSKNADFNSFDRLGFLTKAALPLQFHLGELIKKRGLELNTSGVINYEAKNLFSKNAIILQPADQDERLISLGRKLFFEKQLSQNLTRSCGSCHQPEKYFTDGLPKNRSLDGKSVLQRNAPSLFYSTYQYAQFWDGRVKSIEEQIRAVLNNPAEMGSDHQLALKHLQQIPAYNSVFKRIFQGKTDSAITLHNISVAINAFLSTLAPMNSSFDQYINGNKKALATSQIRGFNLFMGKAQCGTCHYAPLFNGLIPPLYTRTELEVLGMAATSNLIKPQPDRDSGRFTSFPISFYQGAFKTPTVRNVAKTAPYMHNGAFATLQKVMEFYNKGGAAGMGLDMPTQTLSSKPLRLKQKEINDIISFLQSLTDKQPL